MPTRLHSQYANVHAIIYFIASPYELDFLLESGTFDFLILSSNIRCCSAEREQQRLAVAPPPPNILGS